MFQNSFNFVLDTPDPVGNGGTSDTGDTFDKLLGPENRNLILKLIKVNTLPIQRFKSKQSF